MGTTPALIALGSNLGDRKAILDRAIAELSGSPGVVVRRVSRYSETPPVGGPGGQGAFLNAAAALETTLDPFALHRLLIEVEQKAGRVREVRWDARTLDLDLILFGDQIIETPELVVPHPRFAFRRFVLAPLSEVAPDARDPISGRAVMELLLLLDLRPSVLAIDRSEDCRLARQVAGNLAEALSGTAILDDEPDPSSRGAMDTLQGELRWLVKRTERIIRTRDRLRASGESSWIVTDMIPMRELVRLCLRFARGVTAPTPESRRVEEELTFARRLVHEAPVPTIATFLNLDRPNSAFGGNPLNLGARFVPENRLAAQVVDELLACCRATRAGNVLA